MGAGPAGQVRGGDRSPVQLHQMAHDGEAEAQASLPPRARGVGLAEAVEDVGEERRIDAGPAVLHRDLDVGLDLLQAHVDAPLGRGELDRVREEVPHDLVEPAGVRGEGARARVQHGLHPDGLGLDRGLERVEHGLDHGRGIHRLHLEPHLAGDDPRDVEDVGDEPALEAGVAVDDLDPLLDLRRGERALAQEAGPAHDRGERGAQLVGERGQEVVLQPVRLPRLLGRAVGLAEEAGVVEREGGAAGQVLGEGEVLRRVPPSGAERREEGQAPERAVPGLEGQRHEGLYPQVAQHPQVGLVQGPGTRGTPR